MIKFNGLNIYISPNVKYKGTLEVGHGSAVGENDETTIEFGSDCKIGRFCSLRFGIKIGNNCQIGDYCFIGKNSIVGDGVIIETGSRIFSNVRIGSGSIINSNVSNNVIIEDNVRFFGRIGHSHRNHCLDWKTTVEPSPIFRKNCIIGINALIIGAVEIGENSYVAAGEVVRGNIPPNMVYFKGNLYDKEKFRGFIV